MIQFINISIILGLFALCVDGKHMQQKAAAAHQRNVVAEYAAQPTDCTASGGCIKQLSDIQQNRLAALARYVGRMR